MAIKPDKEILNYKKEIFLNEVEKSCNALEVPLCKVNFWNHYEDHFPDNERAHIHLETNTICIAEPELEMMSEEDIKTTASHEVSHMKNIGHGRDFQETHEEVQIGSWRLPHGTVGALPEDYVPPKEDKKKERVVKYICNDCGKRAKTKQCKHCKRFFCEKHINPEEAGFNKQPHKENTHPCMGYNSYLIKKEKDKKKEQEEYGKVLERICKSKKTNTQEEKTQEGEKWRYKPKFFRWAFFNGMTVFFILIFLIIANMEKYIEVPSLKIINGAISPGTEFIVSWLNFSKVFIFLLVGYGIIRYGVYYLKFIMEDD